MAEQFRSMLGIWVAVVVSTVAFTAVAAMGMTALAP